MFRKGYTKFGGGHDSDDEESWRKEVQKRWEIEQREKEEKKRREEEEARRKAEDERQREANKRAFENFRKKVGSHNYNKHCKFLNVTFQNGQNNL